MLTSVVNSLISSTSCTGLSTLAKCPPLVCSRQKIILEDTVAAAQKRGIFKTSIHISISVMGKDIEEENLIREKGKGGGRGLEREGRKTFREYGSSVINVSWEDFREVRQL